MSGTQEQQGIDLEAIEKRAKAATPGPWIYKAGYLKHYVASTDEQEDFGFSLQTLHWRDGHEVPAAENAEFVAHSREDIPALIARVRELEALQLSSEEVRLLVTLVNKRIMDAEDKGMKPDDPSQTFREELLNKLIRIAKEPSQP